MNLDTTLNHFYFKIQNRTTQKRQKKRTEDPNPTHLVIIEKGEYRIDYKRLERFTYKTDEN